jgi:REP element-mobilizing transposase RayT
MSTGYKITDQEAVYFCTPTVVQWADIFTRQVYRDIVVDCFNHCVAHKGLRVHAYVFMSNHIHCIVSAAQGNLSGILRDLKSFSSKAIFREIQSGPESRREWLTMICEYAAGGHARNKDFQIWTHENHPEEIWSRKFIEQKMDYLHNNPVKSGLVAEPHHWLYSSAADYAAGRQVGPINLALLDLM